MTTRIITLSVYMILEPFHRYSFSLMTSQPLNLLIQLNHVTLNTKSQKLVNLDTQALLNSGGDFEYRMAKTSKYHEPKIYYYEINLLNVPEWKRCETSVEMNEGCENMTKDINKRVQRSAYCMRKGVELFSPRPDDEVESSACGRAQD